MIVGKLKKWSRLGGQAAPSQWFSDDVSADFRLLFGNEALEVLLANFDFRTVLDIGSGAGKHAALFERYGKVVTRLDLGESVYFDRESSPESVVVGNYQKIQFDQKFDCIWACHVLEHQTNVGLFLEKIRDDLSEGGVLAITVPPLKDALVGGHLSLWTAGLLLYNLVMAGFDCSQAAVKKYAYNISVIVQKKSFTLPSVHMDKGDVERLLPYFPRGIVEGMGGDISELGWPQIRRVNGAKTGRRGANG